MIDRTNSGQYKNMNRVKKVIKNGYTFKLYNKYWEKAKNDGGKGKQLEF